jgi:two-component system, OmpR family, alkaline phosphatase synthesis response regulator PhoP
MTIFRIVVISDNDIDAARLRSALAEHGFTVETAGGVDEAAALSTELHLALIDKASPARALQLAQELKRARPLPVIALLPRETLPRLEGLPGLDDFLFKPYDISELSLRIKRLVQKTPHADGGELITRGDMVIDLAKCEVVVGGRMIELTFREYELLKFLASHPGRVFGRETLLNRVWGYDFYGGDRTVDVHIRRLRSKIEDATHAFIDTVRNVGYRFVT